jgi:hypothetical protein
MAFIAAAFEAIGTILGASSATAGAVGVTAVGTAATVGLGIAAATGLFSPKAAAPPPIPGLPAPPSLTTAAATAQQTLASQQAATQYSGGTTDITLGTATLNPSNVSTKSLLGA